MSRSSISGVPAEPDADEQAQDDVLRAFLSTAQHFFGGFPTLFAGVTGTAIFADIAGEPPGE